MFYYWNQITRLVNLFPNLVKSIYMTYFTSVDVIGVFSAYKTRAFIIFGGAFRISDDK